MTPFEAVELDQRIARIAADFRRRTHMKLLDAFILATAQVNGGTLIPRDMKAFRPGMPGIYIAYTLAG